MDNLGDSLLCCSLCGGRCVQYRFATSFVEECSTNSPCGKSGSNGLTSRECTLFLALLRRRDVTLTAGSAFVVLA